MTTPSVIAKVFIMHVERARDDKETAGEKYLSQNFLHEPYFAKNA